MPRPRAIDDLFVVRLGRVDWRVSSNSNPTDVLGYIERLHGGRFEVMWMSDPIRWGYAASFPDALAAFGDSVRFTGEIFDDRARVLGPAHRRFGVASQ